MTLSNRSQALLTVALACLIISGVLYLAVIVGSDIAQTRHDRLQAEAKAATLPAAVPIGTLRGFPMYEWTDPKTGQRVLIIVSSWGTAGVVLDVPLPEPR